MKRIILFLMILSIFSCYEEKKGNVIEKKWFEDENTFVIICKGWPKAELTGKARIESAKEAALINAQFSARDLFDKSVDVVKNGTIEKYDVYDDHVAIYYVIKYRNLKRLIKK